MSLIDKALAIAEESEDGWLIKALINELQTLQRTKGVNDDHHHQRA